MKKLSGYVVINEKKNVFYVPQEDSVELTILRVLDGKEFDVIDLTEIKKNSVRHLSKI